MNKKWFRRFLLVVLIVDSLILFMFLYDFVLGPPPPSSTCTVLTNTRYNPTQGYSYDSSNIYVIKTDLTLNNISFPDRSLKLTQDGTGYWVNVTSGINKEIWINKWFEDEQVTEFFFATSGTTNMRLYVGSLGEPHYISGTATYSYSGGYLDFSVSTSTTVGIFWTVYNYIFRGLYNENGTSEGAVNVTAYFIDGSYPETFEVDGTYTYGASSKPQYFSFDLKTSEDVVSQYGLNYLVYNQSTYYDVLFPQLESDTDYDVDVTLTWSSTYTVTNKATSGFRVNFGTPPSDDKYLNWYTYRASTTGGKTREYWLGEDEDNAIIYVLTATGLEDYYITFLDLAGATKTHPLVEACQYVNGTLRVVEKRLIDVTTTIRMALKKGQRYYFKILNGAEYYFGDVFMGDDTTVTLTLKAIDFPQEIILAYRYVRMYGYRSENGTHITAVFQDTKNNTAYTTVYIKYENGTIANEGGSGYNSTSYSFQYTWTDADNSTNYYIQILCQHNDFGLLEYALYLPRIWSEAPFPLDILWPSSLITTSAIIPALIIVAATGVFSALNAQVGAFVGAATATALTWIGWIAIPIGWLVAAWAFVILMGIIYARRRVHVY